MDRHTDTMLDMRHLQRAARTLAALPVDAFTKPAGVRSCWPAVLTSHTTPSQKKRIIHMTTPSLLALVSGIFTPLATVIDKMHTSADERAAAQAEILRLHNEALKLAIDVEKQQLAVSARLIAAEAGGRSWLQRNWRPITMLSFLGLVIADSCGVLMFRLSESAWTLLQIGLGGYVVGRSAEKIAPQFHAMAGRDQRP